MDRLNELLHEAADEAEPTFTMDDVARRVERRRRRRRTASTLAALLFVLGVAGLAVDSQRAPNDPVAGPTNDPAVVSADELTRTRWVLAGYSIVTSQLTALPWIDIEADGVLRGFTGCRTLEGRWAVDGERLLVTDLALGSPISSRSCSTDLMANEQNVVEVLEGKPTIKRFNDDTDTLQLETEPSPGPDQAGTFVFFRAFDSYETPTADKLDGAWNALGGEDVQFRTDDGVVVNSACGDERWTIDDGRLTNGGSGSSACPSLMDGGVRWSGDGPISIRGDADAIYLSSRSGLSILRPAVGPDDEPLRNQTVEDAERDGVVPAVAELPFDVRVEPLDEVAPVTTDEGVWIASRMNRDEVRPFEDDGSCGLGDTENPDARYRRHVICTLEYGEVLLLDADQRSILRAYPFAGLPPQWLAVVDDVVYCGRQGDGALPDSMLCRIDPTTGEAIVRVFPHPNGSGFTDSEEDHLLDGWVVEAPTDRNDFEALRSDDGALVMGEGDARTEVDPDTLELLD